MKKITVRHPHQDEYEVWSKIYQVYLDFYHTSLTDDEMKKVWLWMSEHKFLCYFAEINKEIVGLAHFREYIQPIKACSEIYLDDLIVLSEFHGHGIGYKLIEAIKYYAKEHDIPLVSWITASDNSKAMNLYNSIAEKTTWVTYEAKINMDVQNYLETNNERK